MSELPAARRHYEIALLDNIAAGRRANERLVRAVAEQTLHQTGALSSVVVSQDRMASGISALGVTLDHVSETMGSLLAVASHELAEIAYQQRLTVDSLRQILETLQAPLDTRAKELRKLAEEAYLNGWIDDARADFLESEQLNRYDFTVHHALGTIAFLHTEDLEAAREQFALAAQYARPKSPLDTAYALVAGASVEEQLGSLERALALADDAVGVGRESCPEAYYARGRYRLATGGDLNDARADLETAYWGNPALAVMSMADTVLSTHAADRDAALDAFRAGLAIHTATRIDVLRDLRERLAMVGFEEAPAVYAPVVEELDAALTAIRQLQSRNSIADHLDALRKAGGAEHDAYGSAKSQAVRTADRLRTMAGQLKGDHEQRVADAARSTAWTKSSPVFWLFTLASVALVVAGLYQVVKDWNPVLLLFLVIALLFAGFYIFALIGVAVESLLGGHGRRVVERVSRQVDPRIEILETTASAVSSSVPAMPVQTAFGSAGGHATAFGARPAVRDQDWDKKGVLEALQSRGRMEAVRVYRESTLAGLLEAKDAVDRLAQEHGITPRP